ncbi:hypothetical protein TNCV_2600351 [Trichonephila clavipes]|nr:hypothetical protein TNCV_2600351 [Trichonephila clavipes]
MIASISLEKPSSEQHIFRSSLGVIDSGPTPVEYCVTSMVITSKIRMESLSVHRYLGENESEEIDVWPNVNRTTEKRQRTVHKMASLGKVQQLTCRGWIDTFFVKFLVCYNRDLYDEH